MFYRRKKVINFREPIQVENPLISFEWDKIIIETEEGVKLIVEEKPKKKRKKESEDED